MLRWQSARPGGRAPGALGFAMAAMLLATPARADAAAGEACAKTLPPEASLVYRDSAPDMTKDTTIRAVLTSHVRRMIFEGRISFADARPAATAAAVCLQALLD